MNAEHPARLRHRLGGVEQVLMLALPTFAWSAHLLVKQGLASAHCSFARSLAAPSAAHAGTPRPVLFAIDAAALLVAIAGTLLALYGWRRTRREWRGGAVATAEIGEGRTRFLALCAALLGIGAIVAILFDALASWLVPSCA
jgi:hypothetical protein